MKNITRTLFAVMLSAASFLSSAQPASAPADAPVRDYSVFVDPPTGFAFVKLPQGWKFVGKVDRASVAGLPPDVLTNLVGPEGDGAPAQATARRSERVRRGGIDTPIDRG